MASAPAPVLHRAQLCQTSLGEILHGFLHPVHSLDRSLLLPDGLDGERTVDSTNIYILIY